MPPHWQSPAVYRSDKLYCVVQAEVRTLKIIKMIMMMMMMMWMFPIVVSCCYGRPDFLPHAPELRIQGPCRFNNHRAADLNGSDRKRHRETLTQQPEHHVYRGY